MCGIAGVVRTDGAPVDPILLERMVASLDHRGPDGGGTWQRGPVGLGHRRLSIIDLVGSTQPMVDTENDLALVFNGEVLNYSALRSRLTGPFGSNGDTETLLAAYREHGPDSVTMLRGQFAHAVYDGRARAVRLFRDRVGILPLFWCRAPGAVLFASEVKALLIVLGRTPDVDEIALDDYLARRTVPAPRTLFEGIRKVRPGHRVDIGFDGVVTEHCYWRLEDEVAEGSIRPEDALLRTRNALEDAVRANLVADVPVGTYLSGGLDSSLITALAATMTDGPLRTFSAGFGTPDDETAWARRVSRHLGTDHSELVVRPQDFIAEWHRLTWQRDAPLSEPADVAVHHLARHARRSVKVVLSGEGSDELFGGYPKHKFATAGPVLDRLPLSLLATARSLDRALPYGMRRVRTALRALAAEDEAQRLETWFAPFNREERRRLLGREPSTPDVVASRWRSPLHRQLAHDLAGWLPDNLLERADRMSMAASLEVRPPFLDHHVVELAFALPASAKVRGRSGKHVIRRIAEDVLPHDVVHRPKNGFRVPLGTWFRGELRELAFDALTGRSSFVADVFDRSVVLGFLEDHDRGRRDEHMRLWTLLCLEKWHDVYYKDVFVPSAAPSTSEVA